MPKIDINVELDTSGVAAQARAAAQEAGSALDSEISSGAKSGAKSAGDAIESEVRSGARSGAKSGGSSIDSEVASAGRSAGKAAGDHIADGVESGAEEGARGASEAIGGIAQAAKGALGSLGSVASVAGISELASHAAEAQSQMSRLEASARANSVSADAMGATYSGLVGVLGETDRSVETSGNLFALCGDNQAQLESLTTSLTGAYSQFGDGMPIEALAEAANETAKVGTVTGSMADALNWVSASTDQWSAALSGNSAAQAAFNAGIDAGLSKEDAYNAALAACSTEGERQQLVVDTLNALYGEQGAAYQDANADMIAYNQSQDAMSSSLADLGQNVMPIVTEGANLLSDAIGFVSENSDVCVPVLAGLAAAFMALNVAGMLAGVGISLASAPMLPIIAVIALVVAAVTGLGLNFEDFSALAQSVWQGVCDFVGGIVEDLRVFFTETVPGALSDMVGRFSELPGQIGEFLSSVLSDAAAWVADMGSRALDAGSRFLSNVVSFVTQLPGRVASFLGSVISNVGSWVGRMASGAVDAGSRFLSGVVNFITRLPGQVMGFLSSVISNVGSFAGSMASGAVDAASRFASNLIDGIASLPSRVLSIGQNIVRGIWDGISGMGGWLIDQIGGWAGGVIDNIAGFFGIASPSKVMRRLFRWVPVGAAKGIDDEAHVVTEAMEDMGERAVGGVVVSGALGPGSPAATGAAASVSGSHASRQSSALGVVSQTINFNQPVQTPDQTARAMRMYGHYGLAGVV